MTRRCGIDDNQAVAAGLARQVLLLPGIATAALFLAALSSQIFTFFETHKQTPGLQLILMIYPSFSSSCLPG
jgi:hypothetical protein